MVPSPFAPLPPIVQVIVIGAISNGTQKMFRQPRGANGGFQKNDVAPFAWRHFWFPGTGNQTLPRHGLNHDNVSDIYFLMLINPNN